MSSQTPSWFLEIKSDLATHRLFPFHQSRIFDSTAEIRKLAQLPTCVDWNWYVCQLTHLDESEQSRSTRVLQSLHGHSIFRAQAYFLDKASKSAAASKCGCVRTWGAAKAAPPLSCLRRLCGIRWRTRLTVLRRRAIKLDKVFCRSALPLAVLARTGECHHHHHHHYYFNGACIAFLLLFCQPLSISPLLIFRSRPGFWREFFLRFQGTLIT